MDKDQLAALVAASAEERDISVRQVNHGYIVSGVRRFLDKDTRVLKAQFPVEAIAASVAEAAQSVSDFLNNGEF